MLSMLEEVVLLAVDEKSGGLRSTREFGTAYALVGAVFFDLALARKIDTDTEDVQIIDTTVRRATPPWTACWRTWPPART